MPRNLLRFLYFCDALLLGTFRESSQKSIIVEIEYNACPYAALIISFDKALPAKPDFCILILNFQTGNVGSLVGDTSCFA
jgi:hypothetical protein